MKKRDREMLGYGALIVGGLWLVSKSSQSRACGQGCQVLMSDARGTLVQDLITGIQYWV
jgi:hypothetical protein